MRNKTIIAIISAISITCGVSNAGLETLQSIGGGSAGTITTSVGPNEYVRLVGFCTNATTTAMHIEVSYDGGTIYQGVGDWNHAVFAGSCIIRLRPGGTASTLRGTLTIIRGSKSEFAHLDSTHEKTRLVAQAKPAFSQSPLLTVTSSEPASRKNAGSAQ